MNDPMTRIELLRLVIGRARSNGFKFRHWYITRLGEQWINSATSLQLLDDHRRYYSLLFSHEFARSFWKPGSEITFQVGAQTFQRRMPNGKVATVSRKPFTRRSARPDAWRFHLREMALAEDPLRYLRKYLLIQEAVVESDEPLKSEDSTARAPQPQAALADEQTVRPAQPVRRTFVRPLPEEPPAFLRRPYAGRDSGPELGAEFNGAFGCSSGHSAGPDFRQDSDRRADSSST